MIHTTTTTMVVMGECGITMTMIILAMWCCHLETPRHQLADVQNVLIVPSVIDHARIIPLLTRQGGIDPPHGPRSVLVLQYPPAPADPAVVVAGADSGFPR